LAEAVDRMEAREAEEKANDTETDAAGVPEADCWGGHKILRSYGHTE